MSSCFLRVVTIFKKVNGIIGTKNAECVMGILQELSKFMASIEVKLFLRTREIAVLMHLQIKGAIHTNFSINSPKHPN